MRALSLNATAKKNAHGKTNSLFLSKAEEFRSQAASSSVITELVAGSTYKRARVSKWVPGLSMAPKSYRGKSPLLADRRSRNAKFAGKSATY